MTCRKAKACILSAACVALTGCKWEMGISLPRDAVGVYICAGKKPDNPPLCGGTPIHVCNRTNTAKTVKVYGRPIGGQDIWPTGLPVKTPANSTPSNGLAPLIGYDEYKETFGACNWINYSIVP